jgi:hypothetical protein
LAAFEFSKLSKKEKKEALSMALIASGGAMMSAPNFMQGMGAAGQAFAGTYGDQLKGLRGERRDEDLMRYKSMLAMAQKEDADRRWQAEFGEQKRHAGETEAQAAERIVNQQEQIDISRNRADLEEDVFAYNQLQQQREDAEKQAERDIIFELTGHRLSPSGAASMGLGKKNDIKWVSGVPTRLDEEGIPTEVPISGTLEEKIGERLSMSAENQLRNSVKDQRRANNEDIKAIRESRSFRWGQPGEPEYDRLAAELKELEAMNALLSAMLGEMTGVQGAEDPLAAAIAEGLASGYH